MPRASAQNDHITIPPTPGTAQSAQCPHSPVSSACHTSDQGTGTTIVSNRPVSPATSRVTVSTDTDHQSPIRSAHDCTVQYAWPLRTQAAVCDLPPPQTPVETQLLAPACIAMPPMPTTRANAPLLQAFAEASSALHPYTDGQTETRAFPTVAPTTKLPSSDSTSPGNQSMDFTPSQVPKKLKPNDLRKFF